MTAHLRHNVAALGADYAFFVVGLTLASQSTLLPAFAAYLGAPNVVVGAIPAVMTLGWFLPSLFAAGHTEALPRKLPFILRYTVWERVPFAILALTAFFIAGPAPVLALVLLLLMLLVTTGVGGVLMPAWMDLIGRVIPVTARGRFFAFANLAASAGGFAGSFAIASVLAAVAAPASYGVCFAFATVCMALSYIALAFVREPAAVATAERVTLRAYLSRMPALLGRDRNLSWYLGARAFAVVGSVGGGFYTVYALAAWQAPPSQVGVFTTLMTLGQMGANLVLGWLADRHGHRLVIIDAERAAGIRAGPGGAADLHRSRDDLDGADRLRRAAGRRATGRRAQLLGGVRGRHRGRRDRDRGHDRARARSALVRRDVRRRPR